ncbi:MAG: lytic murein transglycosylase B [Hylemonella sp.]
MIRPLPLLLCALGLLAAVAQPDGAQAAQLRKPKAKAVRAQWQAPGLVEGSGPLYAQRTDAMALADEIAARHGLDAQWVRQTVGRARQLPQILKLVLPPATPAARDWQDYRARFLQPERVQAGVAFWQAHEATLARASRIYGVPAELIVGVLGVETYYGRQLGRYRVLDALTTLALDFPAEHPRAAARTAFFRGELGEFLRQHHASERDPALARGSYAGAMGIPQFMPSSWARYAVDFDGDGRIDLVDSVADAIGSVAHYFRAHGWQPGMRTHYAVSFPEEFVDLPPLLAPDIKPSFDAAQLADRGLVLDEAARQHPGLLALVQLQNGSRAPSYVLGTQNFYVVTRYNWSSFYALAVIELGEAVAAARQQAAAAPQAGSTLSNAGCSASTQLSTSALPICR